MRDFGAGKFRPHGELQMHLDGDIIIYTAVGPFNLEAIMALGKARRAGLARWQARSRKVSIAVFQNSLFMSQDALDAYATGLKRYFDDAPRAEAVAWVVPADVEGRSIMLPKFEHIFIDLGIPWRLFERLEDAKTWISSVWTTPKG